MSVTYQQRQPEHGVQNAALIIVAGLAIFNTCMGLVVAYQLATFLIAIYRQA